ncbi:ATP-binding protein [Marinicella pacifica]|uniref:PhoH-like protein n=1 Tax=Marinicella pacifica TaxID=1171543 RepID=A0A917FIP4_9GAMM|nr:PhoH family protein [Marinicella pacifica]GGF84438.1 ATP-binding protein [Marinicella pacifica]
MTEQPKQPNNTNEAPDNNSVRKLNFPDINNGSLINLYGLHDSHLKMLAKHTGTDIKARGQNFQISGEEAQVNQAVQMLNLLAKEARKEALNPEIVHVILAGNATKPDYQPQDVAIRTKAGVITGRSDNQKAYLHNIVTHDINFGIGPAGTGKTYLAVACAVEAFVTDRVRRLVLVRPAVEAGERLGFLPGDLSEKVDPYLRPLYDALYDMLGHNKVEKMLEKNEIEVAPLAFMRGRTLNDAFVILDEAQNTTIEQMKMFLTRTGFNTTVVVTGDITQIDLRPGEQSGLKHAMNILQDIKGISFSWFKSKDVVRHSLVQKIVDAYDNQ